MSKGIKERIIKDTAKYNIAQYFAQFFGFFSAMAMRRFLGPYYIGIWSLFRVVIDCCHTIDLGVGAAVAYKIPFFKGKNNKETEEEIRDSGFGFSFWTSLLSAIVLLIAAFLLRHKYPVEVIAGLSIISIYMILERVYAYYIVVLRANSNFSVISRSVVFDAAVNLILIFMLVRNFKIYGLYIVVILMALLNTLFVHFFARYKISLKFNPKVIFSLIRYGFPLLLLSFLSIILSSIDRIMIARMIGVTFVGYYSIALMTKNYVIGVSNNFAIVTLPRIVEAYGKEGKIGHMQKFITSSAEIISYLLPSLLGIIFLATPLLVSKILPKFVPGIVAAQILLLDMFFRSCCPQAGQFLVTLGKQARMIPIGIATIIINIGLNYIAIKNGFGIYGVAAATSLASLFYLLVTLSYAMKHFARPREILKFILRIMFPVSYISAVILLCNFFIRLPNAYLKLGIDLLILAIASLPLFIYIDRRTHILRIVFKSLQKVKTR